jgi:hypothetical protein
MTETFLKWANLYEKSKEPYNAPEGAKEQIKEGFERISNLCNDFLDSISSNSESDDFKKFQKLFATEIGNYYITNAKYDFYGYSIEIE